MSIFSRHELEHVRPAIRALPEPTRSIYRLHLDDGLSYEAISARLCVGVSDVEKHIAEAIVLIDRELRRLDGKAS